MLRRVVKVVLLSLLALLAVGAVVVFGVWKPLNDWAYADVLAEVKRDVGADREVLAVEVTGRAAGDVGFVLRKGDDEVEVRHYWHKCVGRSDVIKNGTKYKSSCALRLRRVSTFTRPATAQDRIPGVPLGSLTPDAIDRLEAAGKPDYVGALFYRGRWRFETPDSMTAAPDGSDVRPGKTFVGVSEVPAMVGTPELDAQR